MYNFFFWTKGRRLLICFLSFLYSFFLSFFCFQHKEAAKDLLMQIQKMQFSEDDDDDDPGAQAAGASADDSRMWF